MSDFYDNPSDTLLRYWNSYKNQMISATLLVGVSIFCYTRYNEYQHQKSLAAAEYYYTYIDAQQRDDLATKSRSLEMMKQKAPGKSFTILAAIKEVAFLLESGQWDKAEQELLSLERTAEIKIFQILARYKRAELYYAQKRFDEALALLKDLEEPYETMQQHLLARIYAATGEKQRALAIYEQLLSDPAADKASQALWSAQYQALALKEEVA